MYQPEDDFSLNKSLNNSQDPKLKQDLENLENNDANLSIENIKARKQQLESIFFKLIAFGLILGAILGVGTFFLLNKLGLNKKPYQIEQEKQEQQQAEPSLKEIHLFPSLPNPQKSPSDKI
jgi:uncharacterized membrane protein YciS (DUF1049 family)